MKECAQAHRDQPGNPIVQTGARVILCCTCPILAIVVPLYTAILLYEALSSYYPDTLDSFMLVNSNLNKKSFYTDIIITEPKELCPAGYHPITFAEWEGSSKGCYCSFSDEYYDGACDDFRKDTCTDIHGTSSAKLHILDTE